MAVSANHSDSLFDFEAARHIPDNIYFGTSTWTYAGWQGMIYQRTYKSEKEFKATCLAEYGTFPWFRTVGIDNTFYSPPRPGLLESYATQVPPGFVWVSKAWERLTIPKYPQHARYGQFAGKDNPDFLNAERFISDVLVRYTAPEIQAHTGPFVFQFPTIHKDLLSRTDFFTRLNAFLAALPKAFRYSIEVRNPEFLVPEYFSLLNEHLASHCFNHWNYMPSLHDQMEKAAEAGGLTSDFLVARLLTPLGVSYEKAVSMFQPYDSLKQPLPAMRRDVATFIRRGIKKKVKVYVIVNNRTEGNAPLTIDAIGRTVAESVGKPAEAD